MISAFLLALREGVEIALVIGIVLGALKKTNRQYLNVTVWSGAAAAAGIAGLTAIILVSIGASLEGRPEEIFEGVMMLLAAGVLTWMIFWMQRQSRYLKSELESGVQKATLGGGRAGLFSLAFLAVAREGLELALLLTASAMATNPLDTIFGMVVGLLAAAAIGVGIFAASIRLNLRLFFQVTSLLLVLFAAGLVAHGVHELNEAGLIPAVVEHVWDINHWVSEDSAPGSVLQTLFGYNGNPSLTELIAYGAYLLATLAAVKLSSTRSELPASS
jgi:high-affinity iron transporter